MERVHSTASHSALGMGVAQKPMHRTLSSRIAALALIFLVHGCGAQRNSPTSIVGDGFAPLMIETATLPPAVVGQAYSTTLTASGGDGVYTWSLPQGSPPDGLSLSVSGTISGTPTTAGAESLLVQVNSGNGESTTRQLSLDVTEPAPVGEASP